LTAPITYLLVRRVVKNSLVAAVTGLAVIHWPSFIYNGRTLYSETATLPLFTPYLTLIPRGSILTTDPIKGWLTWFLSGSFLGLCVLFRPMYLLFFSFVVLKAVLAYQRRTHAADALIASPISRFSALIGKAAQKPCAKAHPSTASLRR
jgi:hypothetical protein